MAAYHYECLDDRGRKKKGIIEGDSAKHVRRQLRDKGWMPIEVSQAQEKEKKPSAFQSGNQLNASELALFTRQFATLSKAGLPVEEALAAIGNQAQKAKYKSVVMAVRSKVLEGNAIAESMAAFSNSFPVLYRSTVAAGERSGHLDEVMHHLADYTEQRMETLRAIKQALIYPIVLILFSILIIGVLLTYAVPKIVGVFAKTGQALPVPTQILIGVSDFAQAYWWLLILAGVGLWLLWRRCMMIESFRYRVHEWQLKLPVIGRLALMADTARVASTVNILSSSGVPMVEALRIASDVSANLLIRDLVAEAAEKVQEGAGIAHSLDQDKRLPPMFIQLVASGESSGELETMLKRAADMHEQELKSQLATFVALFGPLALVTMAIVVFGIVISMMLPIINMNNMIG